MTYEISILNKDLQSRTQKVANDNAYTWHISDLQRLILSRPKKVIGQFRHRRQIDGLQQGWAKVKNGGKK